MIIWDNKVRLQLAMTLSLFRTKPEFIPYRVPLTSDSGPHVISVPEKRADIDPLTTEPISGTSSEGLVSFFKRFSFSFPSTHHAVSINTIPSALPHHTAIYLKRPSIDSSLVLAPYVAR